jgi:hypothetical protein
MSLRRPGLLLTVSVVLNCLVASASRGDAAEVRTWTDVAGRKTEAKFVRVFNGEVILEKDGRMLKVPLARFSNDDQKYIREQATSPPPAADPASKTDAASRGVGNAATTPAGAKVDESTADANQPNAKSAAVELRRLRDWRDNAGSVIKARFERFFGSQVVLSVGNRMRTIDFARLSAADQEFLRRNLEAQGRAADVPAVAQAPAASANAEATDSSPPANAGGGLGFPASSLPNFGDMAGRMRQHQEQIRATQEQLRAQVKQMHEEMRTARDRIPRPAPRSAPISTPVAESGAPAAANVQPSVPDLSTPSPTPPAVAAAPTHDPFASPVAASRPERGIPRSPFERNNMTPTPSAQPGDQFAAAPAMEPQYQEIIICGACNKEQKPGFKAGQRCQHCGRTIDEIEDESGNVVDRSSSSTRRNVKFWVWAVIAGISVIGGLIAKLKG